MDGLSAEPTDAEVIRVLFLDRKELTAENDRLRRRLDALRAERDGLLAALSGLRVRTAEASL
jgi:hypothetical protein